MVNEGEPGNVVAILRADIVGSTEVLSSRGVEAAISAQRAARSAVERVSETGNMLEFRGDGALVSFHSATDALEAAWRLREEVADEDFRLRIGVTLEQPARGQTMSAALYERTGSFESRCEPGSIMIDNRILRAVRGHDGVSFNMIDDDACELISVSAPQRTNQHSSTLRVVLFTEPIGRSEQADTLAQACIEAHCGVVVNVNGGQFMATFASSLDAADAANALHAEAASQRQCVDAPPNLSFRVAVSVGEIVQSDIEGFGVAVIEAARLVAMADGDSTLVTRDVAQLAALEPAETSELGMVSLKGLTDRVEVVAFQHDGCPSPLLELPPALALDAAQPMIGREDQLQILMERLAATSESTAGVVVVEGEEGIGKTRLVSELASAAHARGVSVMHGACEQDPRAPFAPIVEALKRAAALDPKLASALLEGSGALGSLFGLAPAASEDAMTRGQSELFGAVADVLQRLANARPVLLAIDDVQWASNDMARLLIEVIDTLESSRILVVLTHRSEKAVKSDALAELLKGTDQRVRRHYVPLNRLERTHMAGLIESRTSSNLARGSHDLAAAVAKFTGGNPLYAEEFLTHLILSRVLVEDPESGWTLAADVTELAPPDSIIDLMEQRINRLGTDTCRLLGVAALMGSSFDLEVLAAVTGDDLGRVLDAIQDATNSRLLRPAEDEGVRAFGDEIARAAFLRHVPVSRRALVHGQLAEAIERLRPNQIDELIVHWSAAIGHQARSKVLHYLQLATERDLAAAAWESAVDRARRTLTLINSDDPVLECETLLLLGKALRLLGRDSYRPELTAAADLARRLRDPERLFQAASSMMRPGEWAPEVGAVHTEIVEMCEDVLLLINDPEDPIRLRALAALATNLAYDPDPTRRNELVTEAQQRARDSGDLRLLGSALAAELQTTIEPQTFERRRIVADEVRRIGRATSDDDLLFSGTFHSLLDALERGAIETVDSHLFQLRKIADVKRDFFSRYRVAYLTAVLSLARCETGAKELIDAAHQMAEGEPVDAFAPMVIQTATLSMYHGTLSDILLPIAQAADMWDESWSQRWDFALAKAYLDTGQHELAAEIVRRNPEPEVDSYWLASYCQLAEVGWLLGFPDVCERVIEKLTPFRGRFAVVGGGLAVVGLASVALGQASLALGHVAAAEELFAEAAELAESAGFGYFTVNARRLLAQALLAADPASPEATRLLRKVLEDAKEHGFRNEELLAESLLTSAGSLENP